MQLFSLSQSVYYESKGEFLMDEMSLRAKDSFEEVLNTYKDMVYRLAFSRLKNSFDANDIMQEVFLKYIKADMTYNDEEHRKAWLIKITINATKTLISSAWFRRHISDEEIERTEGAEDETIRTLEDRSVVYSAVMELPIKYRTVVHLFYYEDLTVAKISNITGEKETTIKSQLHRAREMLKEKLKGVDFVV